MFTEADKKQIESKRVPEKEVLFQIEKFKHGMRPMELARPAVVGDGILRFSDQEQRELVQKYEGDKGSVFKFVPASGAASRMFKHLFEFKDSYSHSDEGHNRWVEEKGKVREFFKRMEDFAFYKDLKKAYEEKANRSLEEGRLSRDYAEILHQLLENEGLGYGQLPKGLIKFHRYKNEERTPSQEQVIEGLGYAQKSGKANIHFTVSPEHQPLFEEHLNIFLQSISNVGVTVDYSIQKPSTDTIAVDEENQPFRDDEGKLLFRPAGHGALLKNLSGIDADILFIKNIDNVVPDRLKEETIFNKKLLAGVLLRHQEKVFDLLKRSEVGENIVEEGAHLLKRMGCEAPLEEKEVFEHLNRPIRVCGMVKNVGEPGGGPFWVKGKEAVSLQIVESTQVDHSDAQQANILARSTHFNPVDMVCGQKNHKGGKFNLLDFRDENAGFITDKSYGGRKLKAMELPGLWNGSMAHWNTLFVEVPLVTFNPVKTVNDLLRPEHQP